MDEQPRERKKPGPKPGSGNPERHWKGRPFKAPPEFWAQLDAAVPERERSAFIRAAVLEKLARVAAADPAVPPDAVESGPEARE